MTRKPLPAAPRRRPNAVRNALLIAALPTTFLLFYVLAWTMAISGGYSVDRLRAELGRLRVEQADLRNLKNSATSPKAILTSAMALKMHPAPAKKFIQAPQEK